MAEDPTITPSADDPFATVDPYGAGEELDASVLDTQQSPAGGTD